MRFQLETGGGLNVIRAYADGVVRVGERAIDTNMIITASQIVTPWEVSCAQTLDENELAPVLALNPEVILFGTGRSCLFPSARLRALVQSRNIGFECMDTAAACRTYNILVTEDRRVAAALIV